MGLRYARTGFTLLELLLSVAVVSVLLTILLPSLSSARVSSRRALCAGNQRLIGRAWDAYLQSNDGRFPTLYVQPAWFYGGVRFSSVDGAAFVDYDRPLNRYLPTSRMEVSAEDVFRCPADRGITDQYAEVGTGRRTAHQAFGTSYRANARLLAPRPTPDETGLEPRGLKRDEITTAPARLVVMGDPVWYETLQSTGRLADWHGTPNTGNLLFLDGSVRFISVQPRPGVGAAVFDPLAAELAFPVSRP